MARRIILPFDIAAYDALHAWAGWSDSWVDFDIVCSYCIDGALNDDEFFDQTFDERDNWLFEAISGLFFDLIESEDEDAGEPDGLREIPSHDLEQLNEAVYICTYLIGDILDQLAILVQTTNEPIWFSTTNRRRGAVYLTCGTGR